MFKSRRRTPIELLAGLARYGLNVARGQREVYRYAGVVARNLSRPLDQLEVEQDRAIEAIVNHAYENSPFYRERFSACGFKPGDVKNRCDLARLPEVTKSDLANNIDRILCLPKNQLGMSSTGGTSGIALNFYRDQRCLAFRRGIDLATNRYYGWRDGQWQAWLWGAPRDVLKPTSLKARLIHHCADRTFFIDALQITNDAYREFSARVRKHRPTYMSAYPSLAYDLAQRIESGEVEPFRVPMVNFTAEPVYDFQAKRVADTFGEQVYQRYGSREIGMAALECPARTGLHYFTESVYLEAVDHGADMPGRSLIATDLWNYGMPIIRYHTGDFADLEASPCPCGRTSPRITNIRGRELDMIWTPEGHGIAGVMLVFLIAHLQIRVPIQIVQEAIDHIVVRAECNPLECGAELADLMSIYRREVSAHIRFQIEYVDRIERAASGKYRYVVSKVSRPM